MSGQPDLLVPGKNLKDAHQPGYRIDMQTIEMWAKRLTAGSGRPSGDLIIASGPESGADNTDNNGGIFFTAPNPEMVVTLTPTSYTDLGVSLTFGFSWVISTLAGNSVVQMPAIQMPAFTGPPTMSVQLQIGAVSADNTQQARWDIAGGLNLASGTNYQTLDTDWTNEYNNGGDITLVAGTGDGSGLVTTAGGLLYFGSVVGTIAIIGATFT